MIFVGPWKRVLELNQKRPDLVRWVRRAHELDYLHPKGMAAALEEIEEDVWTNNPYALDGILPERVVVLTPSGPRSLTECPDYERMKDMFSTGELWSAVGEEW